MALLAVTGLLAVPAGAATTAGDAGTAAAAAGVVYHLTINGKGFGEVTNAGAGVLIVLYTTGSSTRIDTSGFVLAIYRNYRKTHNIQGAATLTLRALRSMCGSGFAGSKCRDATADSEWRDFRDTALVPFDANESRCLAASYNAYFGDWNWTTRPASDTHCK